MPSVPLRPILVIPFVIQILAVVGLTGYISYQNGQKAVNHLSFQLRDEVTERVQEHLNYYFHEADKITETAGYALQTDLIKKDDLPEISRFFWNQAKINDVSYINYGLKTGEYAGAGYCIDRKDSMTLTEISKRTGFKGYNYLADDRGNPTGKPDVIEYDFRREPWFSRAIELKRPLWTPPYVWDNNPNMISMAISRPVLDSSGRVIGAVSVDLSLTKISDFLRQIKISPTGKVLVLDNRGKLIAGSGTEQPFRSVDNRVEQLTTLESTDAVTRNASYYLSNKFNNFQSINNKYSGEFNLNNERYFIQVTPWKDRVGLNLLILVIVPERDFMGAIQKNTHLTIIVCIIALIFSILVGLITSKYVSLPIIETVSAAELISRGKWTKTLPKSSIKELDSLRKSFNKMSEQLQKSFDDLEYTAYHDSLTGLPNQLLFRKELEKRIDKYRQNPELFSVLFLDLDFFKLVNDSLGHLTGDVLLVRVAGRLKKCVRENDLVARFGGDEFVILLDKLHYQREAIEVADRICKELQKSFKINDNEVFINTSIGIVFSDILPISTEEILKNADISLYRAKSSGKGKYTIFNRQMSIDSQKRLSLETDLRRAIDRREIEVYYQPIFNIAKKEIVGFEALMRWRHSKLGHISPEVFIPIAEETGLIGVLGWWTARQACYQLRRWQERFPECTTMKMNVNFSGKQFFEPDFVEQIRKILLETKLQPYNLGVEVTESIFIKYTDVMRDKLLELNGMGVKINLDDFGVGYSCLSYLKDFTIDTLKIDRSFTQNLIGNPQTLAILESIALLADKLNIELIAEGIETQEQLEIVHYLGCYQGQGYLFSRPLRARKCERLLESYLLSSGSRDKIVIFPPRVDDQNQNPPSFKRG